MKELAFYIIFVSLFGGICIFMEAVVGSIECHQKGQVLNYKTEWHYWTGCIVCKSNGEKVLLKQMRDFDGDKVTLKTIESSNTDE